MSIKWDWRERDGEGIGGQRRTVMGEAERNTQVRKRYYFMTISFVTYYTVRLNTLLSD